MIAKIVLLVGAKAAFVLGVTEETPVVGKYVGKHVSKGRRFALETVERQLKNALGRGKVSDEDVYEALSRVQFLKSRSDTGLIGQEEISSLAKVTAILTQVGVTQASDKVRSAFDTLKSELAT